MIPENPNSSRILFIHLNFNNFLSGSVAPENFPTTSDLVPKSTMSDTLTPIDTTMQTALSPSVKPPGFTMPSMEKGV